MNFTLRPGTPDDAQACGVICYEAFTAISRQHNFPADFPAAEAAIGLMEMLFSRPDVYSVVAEKEGRVVGSNFLWESGAVSGVGPITVDCDVQNSTLGRRLMENILERAQHRGCAGVRLVQAAYHGRSLALYTKLGFDAQEPLSCLNGPALGISIPGYAVRAAQDSDLENCNRLCEQVHGFNRGSELQFAIEQGNATLVEHDGRVTGYATMLGFFGHAVGETNEDIKALIGAAEAFSGPGILLPTRNAAVLRWCLEHGLRIVQPLTLMSRGLYNQPAGAFLPSILY
jgi:predicted N-acetyltransferase YhbS